MAVCKALVKREDTKVEGENKCVNNREGVDNVAATLNNNIVETLNNRI